MMLLLSSFINNFFGNISCPDYWFYIMGQNPGSSDVGLAIGGAQG